MVGKGETTNTQLDELGDHFLGAQYVGTFAGDRIPTLKHGQGTIVNLDYTGDPGSHWVALAKHNDMTYFYDSFGRNSTTILPSTHNMTHLLNTEDDPEQLIAETNCGQRSLAWLLIFKHWGPQLALLI